MEKTIVKTERAPLTSSQKKKLEEAFSQTPDTHDIPEISTSDGFRPLNPDAYFSAMAIRDLRKRVGVSQTRFSRMIGVNVHTLRNWEQGKRRPEGPAIALLKLVSADPEYVRSILEE